MRNIEVTEQKFILQWTMFAKFPPDVIGYISKNHFEIRVEKLEEIKEEDSNSQSSSSEESEESKGEANFGTALDKP